MSLPITPLLSKAQLTLGLSQGELGKLLGASTRTGQRWAVGEAFPSDPQVCELARRVHPRDPALAEEIAAEAHTTPLALGLVAPPPAPFVPPADRIVDSVVCAAAEAMGVMPGAIRPALLAAVTRAREIGLTMDAMESALRAALHPPPAPKERAASKGAKRGG